MLAADCTDGSTGNYELEPVAEDDLKPKFVVMMKRVGPAKENSRHVS